MEKIRKALYQSEPFRSLESLASNLKAGEMKDVRGLAGSLLAFAAEKSFEARQTQILLIASDEDRAGKLRDDCALLLGEANVRFFGTRPTHQAQSLDVSSSIAQIETLKSLSAQQTVLVVASPQSIAEKVPLPASFRQKVIELARSSNSNFQQLLQQLDELGFDRKDFVGGYGEYAVRGGIVDIFPFVGENPVRLEFWGDAVESIREFDALSQRSIRELESASIVPDLSARAMESDSVEAPDSQPEREIPNASLFDYLQSNALVILDEPEVVEREIGEMEKGGTRDILTYREIVAEASRFARITHSLFQPRNVNPISNVLDFSSISQPSFNGSIDALVREIERLTLEGYRIYLTCDTQAESRRLNELIEEAVTAPGNRRKHEQDEISDGQISDDQISEGRLPEREPEQPETRNLKPETLSYELLTETLHSGCIYHPSRLAVFTEHEIFNRLKRRGLAKRRRFRGITQKEIQQLKRGDYVVHVDHGIGTFAGLTKLKVGGVEQEVMKLLFLENDVLYVNLNFVNRVQKYASQEGHMPKLNRLGAGEWEKAKARAKKRIKDIARDIIALYARRKLEKGTSFSPDSHWQKELEASFMYEDTADQARATAEVKQDMENPHPMDRLVCGDVGFGKTEVAVRAAFKAVMDGKQVAVLVPTTILALQHYNTFQDRLSRYSVRIENITRFRSTKEQKAIVQRLKDGTIDIIIGTHRLLSKDVGFKDIGLLIIDEEHRFGVSAKEKLRQYRASVDTLSLTATPIPRTLHFSLIGARDLSLINTPPRNRLPIVTEIIPTNTGGRKAQWQVVREAILRELHRGGQIYFVHDKVHDIDRIADLLKTHVAEARVHVAHGQMEGHELEKTMLDFLEKKYDVLIATKIIESGLDIPNVNTIIINRADRFGLAELYQLRGRVGRSNVQAYAYLLTPPLSTMPKPTLRRLQAIEEFTELGSGFNLAMRDLEIRGAGNIFGAEQSGFILEMGFEMYERIVREAVDELKQEEFQGVFEQATLPRTAGAKPSESVVETNIEALIPDFYVEADSERLDIYRRLYGAQSDEDLQSMQDELRDRFGEYPEEVEHLFGIVALRLAASRAGVPKVTLRDNTLTLVLPDETDIAFYGKEGEDNSPFQQIIKKIQEDGGRSMQLKQEGKTLTIRCTMPLNDDPKARLGEAKRQLEKVGRQLSLEPEMSVSQL